MWGLTPFDQLWCRIHFRSLRYDGMYTPVGVDRTSLFYPGIGGGMNWGGVSVDPERGIMLVNSLRIGTTARLLTRSEANAMQSENSGKAVFHSLSAPLPQAGTPYAVLMGTFVSPLGVPCNQPPYGLMSAVDLNTRQAALGSPAGRDHRQRSARSSFRNSNDHGSAQFWGLRNHARRPGIHRCNP